MRSPLKAALLQSFPTQLYGLCIITRQFYSRCHEKQDAEWGCASVCLLWCVLQRGSQPYMLTWLKWRLPLVWQSITHWSLVLPPSCRYPRYNVPFVWDVTVLYVHVCTFPSVSNPHSWVLKMLHTCIPFTHLHAQRGWLLGNNHCMSYISGHAGQHFTYRNSMKRAYRWLHLPWWSKQISA